MKTFPTIKEMETACRYAWNASDCEYNAEDHSFRVIELIPFPVYYGGSIDCVDFEEVAHRVTFLEAYRIWSDITNPEVPEVIPEPVSPCYGHGPEEFDLPF